MALLSKFYKSGQSLVEIIIAMGLSVVILPTVYLSLMTIKQNQAQFEQRATASAQMRQMVEDVRQIRRHGWVYFAYNGVYHTEISATSAAVLVSGPVTTDGFTRSLTISDVERDVQGKIVVTGGTVDPSTKKVVYEVSWETPNHTLISTTAYLTRYLENLSFFETTYAQFNAGTTSGTIVNNVAGDGNITLGGGGHGDWCLPTLTQWGFNLNHSASGKAISAIPGRAFVVTGDTNNSEPFYDVTISDTYPPTATSSGSLAGQRKVYGVFGDNTYAYLATDTNTKQGIIVLLSSHQDVGSLDLQSASKNGRSIVVSNDSNYAYLSSNDNKISVFDISTKIGTHTALPTPITLTATAVKMVIADGNLYAALDSTSNQFAIIPITGNGSALGTPVYINIPGQSGRDVFIDGKTAYFATGISATQKELFIVDIDSASPSYKTVLASQDTNGMDPHGVVAVTNNKVIIVGMGGYEYQVYNYDKSNHSFSTCTTGSGLLNIDTGVNGIASVVEADGDAYSYIITGDSAQEFKIIEGGPNGQVGTDGYFLSAIHDFGSSTAINHLSFSGSVSPPSTNITFQIALADPVSNSCTNADYVYMEIDPVSGAIPYNNDGIGYENPGRCLRYRASFTTTSSTSTPVLNDVTINYSP